MLIFSLSGPFALILFSFFSWWLAVVGRYPGFGGDEL